MTKQPQNIERQEFSSSRDAFAAILKRPTLMYQIVGSAAAAYVIRFLWRGDFAMEKLKAMLLGLTVVTVGLVVAFVIGILLGPLWDRLLGRHIFVKPKPSEDDAVR